MLNIFKRNHAHAYLSMQQKGRLSATMVMTISALSLPFTLKSSHSAPLYFGVLFQIKSSCYGRYTTICILVIVYPFNNAVVE